jgi:hypothetical protein
MGFSVTTEIILKLVEFLFVWLAKNELMKPLIPTLKNIADSFLPAFLSNIVPKDLTAAQVLKLFFDEMLAHAKGHPFIVASIKICQAAAANALPFILSQVLGVSAAAEVNSFDLVVYDLGCNEGEHDDCCKVVLTFPRS